MPTPPSTLVNALRNGTVSRHIFFKMTHSSGTVRAWDGVGKFSFGGETYLGVYGFASVEGVSNSGDIQNHEIIVKLSGVALKDISDVDSNIRQETASLTVVWIQENGAVLDSRIIFSGKGDVLVTKVDEDSRVLSAKLRPPLAEWSSPPRAYYTPQDQARRYPDDDGFKFVKGLENASVTGWGLVEESSGGLMQVFGFNFTYINRAASPDVVKNYFFPTYGRDTITKRLIGDNGVGLNMIYAKTKTVRLHSTNGSFVEYDTTAATWKEQTSNAAVSAPTGISAAYLKVGGNNCYVDAAGDIRTAGGKLIVRDNTGSKQLRLASLITANGAATASTISRKIPTINNAGNNADTYNYYDPGINGSTKYGGSTLDQSEAIICNYYGNAVKVEESTGRIRRITKMTEDLNAAGTSYDMSCVFSDTYVEDVTGAEATMISGVYRVGGTNCVISANGVVLSPGGRRIVNNAVAGGLAFLRVWR